MTMLPDIDEQSWDEYARQQLQTHIGDKISGLTLDSAIGDKISGLHSLVGGTPEPPPPPPPPPPEPEPPPPPPPAPEPMATPDYQAPGTEPAPSAPPAEPGFSRDQLLEMQQQAEQPSTPPPAPAAPTPAPTPTPTATPSGGLGDWFGSALGAVERSGGDARQFASSFSDTAGDTFSSALSAASRAGANVQQFADSLPPMPQPTAPEITAGTTGGARPSGAAVGSVPGWLADLISSNAPPDLASDPDFIRTVAAGAKAESGWNVNSVQKGGGGRGLFQFDLGGMGAPYANNEQVLLGDSGAQLQASQIVPLYAKAYRSAPGELSGAEKASWVAAQAERPAGYDTPGSSARRNYASAYGDIGGGVLGAVGEAVGGAASAVGTTARQAVNQISQFGDSQLTADEAYAACGPAAAVRFASAYGRNPTLREATDMAREVGWTSGAGMAGISSEQKLMDKMGIPTKLVAGAQWDKFATEAQSGNPVTISTQGHYYFADGYDPTSGAFHVGRSGTDLKGGSEWMTPSQMEARMGPVQGALLADNPQVPAPSTADADTNPLGYLGRLKDSAVSGIQQKAADVSQAASQPLNDIYGNLSTAATGATITPAEAPPARTAAEVAGTPVSDLLAQAGSSGAADVLGQVGAGVTERLGATGLRAPSQTVQRQILGQEPVQVGPVSVGGVPGQALGLGGVLGEVSGGPSEAYPSGGPLAGPVTGALRTESGTQQLTRDFEAQTGVPYARFEQMVGQEALDIRQGARSDFSPEVAQLREQWNALGGMGAATPAYARVPEAQQQMEAELPGSITQGVASTLLLPGGVARTPAGLAKTAAALAIDPTNIPFTAGGELAGEAGRLIGGLGRAERLGAGRVANIIEEGGQEVPVSRVPQLHQNITGAVSDAVNAALGRAPNPEELASASQALADAPSYGKAALSAFPEIQTPEGLAGVRNQLRALADQGADQRHWYEESSRDIMAAAQGNPEDAEKIAQLVGIYSNNTPVAENLNNAITAWSQWKNGMPIDAPTLGGNNLRARQLLEEGKNWEGAKTNNFYRNLMKYIDQDKYLEMGKETGQTGVTVDVWMMRALNSLRKSPSKNSGQYEFAANEINNIAKERGWSPEEAQAAIWVATKAGWENAKRKVPMDLSREGIYHYGTALQERLGQYGGAGAEDIGRVVRDASGVDTVARDLGLLGADGKIFLPKARGTRAELELPEAVGTVDAAARQAMNVYTAGVAKTLKLPEASWAREFDPRKLDEANGLVVDAGRALSADEVAQLQDNLDMLTGQGVGKIIPTDNGAWIINRSDSPNKAFHIAGRKALETIESVDTVREAPRRFDAEFFSNDWSSQPNGEGYLDSIRRTGGSAAERWQEIESRLAGHVSDAGRVGAAGAADTGVSLADEAAAAVRNRPAGADLGLPGPVSDILSRGAGPLRTAAGRGALEGGVAGGYSAAQEEGATPQDIIKGALAGAGIGAVRSALPGVGGARVGRLANLVSRTGEAFDTDGRLLGRPSEVDRKLYIPGRAEGQDLAQLVSPAGNLLSTVASGEARIPGKPGWNDLTAISRTLAGAEPWTLNPPSEAARKAMPNLLHMANDMPEVQATLQRIAEDNPGLMAKYTQGEISHDALVEDTAKKLGMTADDFLKTKVGQAFNPQELLALRAAVADKHDQIDEMARYIKGRGGASGLSSEERVGAVRLMLEAGQLQAVGRGAVATAGRALNQQKINVDRQIASMLTRGNELRSSQRALTQARARQAWANNKLGTPIEEAGDAVSADVLKARGGDVIRGQAKQGTAAYDDWLKAVQDELKAQNNYDAKTWDDTLKKLDAEQAKKFPRDATAEGQREWLAAQARVATKDANVENQRAIAAWNRQLREGETKQNMAGRILERLGGEKITNEMIDHMVRVMDSDDPLAAAKYLQSLQKVSWWDRLSTMRYASMLSSTATHSAQLVSNTGQLGMALATHPISVGVDAVTQAVKGGERQRYMSELPAMLRGIVGQSPSELADSPYMVRGAAGGVRQGASDAWEIMKSGLNPGEVSRNWEQIGRPGFGAEQFEVGGKRLGARTAGAVNLIAEGPLRLLEAGDSLIRGGARGAFAYGMAERQAIREGFQGAAKRSRVDEIVKNFNEFPELFAGADDAAKRVVLQERRPSGLAAGLMQARKGPEGLAMSMVMPFVRTPWNVAAQGAGMTPLGFAGALRAAQKGERGEAADRAARAVVGTGVMGAATMLGAQGFLTGGTPTDPSEKSSLPPNWQPYSLRVPHADGSSTYVKYSNLGPIGVPLAAGAIMGDAAADANRKGEAGTPVDPGSVVMRMVGGMGRYMIDQTMLQGLANVVDALGDPERKSQNFVEGLVSQFAPYAAAGRQLDRALGTGPRDTREGYQGLLDTVLASYPGTSGNVPQRLDPLGRNVQATQTGLGAYLSPATYSQSPYDPLTEGMRNADVGISGPPKAFRNMAMTEQERRDYTQQGGYYVDQLLRQLLADPSYQAAPRDLQQAAMRRVIENARNAGGVDIMGRLSQDEMLQRYQQEQARTAAVPR